MKFKKKLHFLWLRFKLWWQLCNFELWLWFIFWVIIFAIIIGLIHFFNLDPVSGDCRNCTWAGVLSFMDGDL